MLYYFNFGITVKISVLISTSIHQGDICSLRKGESGAEHNTVNQEGYRLFLVPQSLKKKSRVGLVEAFWKTFLKVLSKRGTEACPQVYYL